VAKDGVTASGYSAEYTREIRAVSYSPVSDEIIPSNAKDTCLARHVECLQPARVFTSQCKNVQNSAETGKFQALVSVENCGLGVLF